MATNTEKLNLRTPGYEELADVPAVIEHNNNILDEIVNTEVFIGNPEDAPESAKLIINDPLVEVFDRIAKITYTFEVDSDFKLIPNQKLEYPPGFTRQNTHLISYMFRAPSETADKYRAIVSKVNDSTNQIMVHDTLSLTFQDNGIFIVFGRSPIAGSADNPIQVTLDMLFLRM